MKQFFKTLCTAAVFIVAVVAPVMTLAAPQPVAASNHCERSFLGIPPWYRGLTDQSSQRCDLKSPNDPSFGGIGGYIWIIVLNVIQMAVSLLTLVTVFFIMYGGFLYLTGGAIPAQLEKAKKTIFNAVIGLVICLAAVALTNLTFSIIT